jgi:hypothetical protein
MHWILRQLKDSQDQAYDVRLDWFRVGASDSIRS